MMHFSCDICGKQMLPKNQARYVVQMEVFAATDPSELTEDDLDPDHLEEISQILADEDKTSLDNWTLPVCDPTKAPTVDQCTQATLITGGSASEFLWADSTHLTPAGHRSIGSLAVTRATNNPF